MRLELGPIFRAMSRRRSAITLLVLELASGFTLISCLLLSGVWYRNNGHAPIGHDERDLIAVATWRAAGAGDPGTAAAAAIADEAATAQRIGGVADVVAVAAVSTILTTDGWGYPASFAGTQTATAWPIFTSGPLPEVLQLRFVEGASPSAAGAPDLAALADAAIVTRSLRDQLFGRDVAARGRTIRSRQGQVLRIVGVVDDIIVRAPFLPNATSVLIQFGRQPEERQARYLVRARPGLRDQVMSAVRAALGPSAGAGPARLVAVNAFDSSRTAFYAATNGLLVIVLLISGTVAAVALLGTLAVSSFLVVERTRQIGIRRALGGTRIDIVRYFVVEITIATAIGSAIGLVSTLVVYRLMLPVFPGLAIDPRLLIVTALLLWLDATVAVLIPALRAARISPSVASRAA
jgi:putative ABC transport system permease protein